MRAGLLAATFMALMPEMIERGAHVRMHSLFTFLILLAVYALHEGFTGRDDRRMRLIGTAALTSAPFAHLIAIPLAVPLLGSLALSRIWLALRRHGRIRFSPLPWLEALILVAGAALRWQVRSLSGPWGAGGRYVTDPDVLLNIDYLVPRLVGWTHQFVIPPYLLLTTLIIAGGLGMILRLARRNTLPQDVYRFHLAIVWLGSLAGMAIFFGLHSPGYVIPLVPLWALLGAAEIDFLASQLGTRFASSSATAMMVTVSATLLILALIAPRVQDIVTRDQLELDEAFALVRESMRPGDIIAAFSPPAASIELGRVDYYAQEHGAGSFIRSGEQVGIWLGTPVINSAEMLAEILDGGKRVWLVIDEMGWRRHYSSAYRDLVEKRMRPVGEFTGVLVFVLEG
jgi:hypothetical protein